jgi:outer membrane lipoprotein-sorting protein
MKKITIVAFLLSVGLQTLHAQDVNKAKEILNKVSAQYKKYANLKVDFKYINEVQGDKKFREEEKGTLSLKKTKFELDMTDQVVISDGKTLWTYIKDAKEVQINNYSSKVMDVNPAEIFTMYEKGYLYGYTGEESEGKRTLQVIELTPNDKKQSFFKVKLYINKANSNIVKSKIYEKSGNIYTYEILNQVSDSKMPDTMFSWDPKKYPGVKTVDLRSKK